MINLRRNEWAELVTLDNVASHKPDVLFDLERIGEPTPELDLEIPEAYFQKSSDEPTRLPFTDDEFDELHAYEVLEHIGRQGDAPKLFAQFSEFWRVLEPGGLLCASCPSWASMWAWGDPSHTRIISPGTLVFLSQAEYTKQIGKTAMSDFRHIYRADFEPRLVQDDGQQFFFALEAIKPSRISV